MKEMKIGITALYRPEEYVMHLRKGDQRRGAVGLIGFVGGKKKPKETYRQAAWREMTEETSLKLPIDSLEPMSGVYKVISDYDNEEVAVWTKLFRVLLPYGTVIEATKPEEDEIVTASTPDIIEYYLGKGRLSPATERGYKDYLLQEIL